MNNPEVSRIKYPIFILAFLISMCTTALSAVNIMLWQLNPGAIVNMNVKVMYGILLAQGFSNVILLGSLINHAERADIAERKLTERNKLSKS